MTVDTYIATVATAGSRVEAWTTRFGKSVRVVERDPKGRILNHKSGNQLVRIQTKGK
jgi:hypothetical protein